ncbi:MAG: hypothetical protein ACREE4_16105, partial [Stellaceae bacterium]
MTANPAFCEFLYKQLDTLHLFTYPFDPRVLPRNGVYFFYEEGELRDHQSGRFRIVRVGSHSGSGNLGSRMNQHFLLKNEEKKMKFADGPAPHHRSVFRSHIGRAFLNINGDPYLPIWRADFTKIIEREKRGH